MPDILQFKGSRWELVIWTRDSESPRNMLKAVLEEREKSLSQEKIYLSFSLNDTVSYSFGVDGVNSIPIEVKDAEIDIPEPLLYENRDYEFEFTFNNGYTPDSENPVIHRLSEIENCFRTKGQSVRGTLNFGNNIGWFKIGIRYSENNKQLKDTLSFKVYPTKMDMENDLDEIGKVIDSVYPLWRFSLSQKTDYTLSRSKKRQESFELLWIAQFKSLVNELNAAVKLICRSPHSRLLDDTKYLKAERINGKITGKLEQKIKENILSKNYEKRYRIEKRKLSFDTPENRFVKMVLSFSAKKLKQFSSRVIEFEKKNKKNPENTRLSKSFFDELKELTLPMEKLSSEPLFKEIGTYNGQMRESLVLHQRAGYAQVYRIWQMLKQYLDFFGSDASISVRSVEQLYEIWCLLEVRNILLELGFSEPAGSPRNLKTKGIEKNFTKKAEIFRFTRLDGVEAVLIHEPSYRYNEKEKVNGIYSWTTTQRPDIFLEIKQPSGEYFRWVFDAKYRIDADENSKEKWPESGIDRVPEDAVNQMHRYRDSLIYSSQSLEDGKGDKSRPIIGAFALYPGWFNQLERKNPYQESINEVGIGAFPLLPGKENTWLKEFLTSNIGSFSPNYCSNLNNDTFYLKEPIRISSYGMTQQRYNDLLLAADVFKNKGDEYTTPFLSGSAKWYHIPQATIAAGTESRHIMKELRFCAFRINSTGPRVCEYIYSVKSVRLEKRKNIDQYAGGPTKHKPEAPYWLLELGPSFKCPVDLSSQYTARSFKFRLFTFSDLLDAKSWDDIPGKYVKR
jgi:predicted component of viral defense system (DUF524 family)